MTSMGETMTSSIRSKKGQMTFMKWAIKRATLSDKIKPLRMERKPTRPAPVTSGKKKSGKKKSEPNELTQAIASIRQSVVHDPSKEKSEHEEMESPRKK